MAYDRLKQPLSVVVVSLMAYDQLKQPLSEAVALGVATVVISCENL